MYSLSRRSSREKPYNSLWSVVLVDLRTSTTLIQSLYFEPMNKSLIVIFYFYITSFVVNSGEITLKWHRTIRAMYCDTTRVLSYNNGNYLIMIGTLGVVRGKLVKSSSKTPCYVYWQVIEAQIGLTSNKLNPLGSRRGKRQCHSRVFVVIWLLQVAIFPLRKYPAVFFSWNVVNMVSYFDKEEKFIFLSLPTEPGFHNNFFPRFMKSERVSSKH